MYTYTNAYVKAHAIYRAISFLRKIKICVRKLLGRFANRQKLTELSKIHSILKKVTKNRLNQTQNVISWWKLDDPIANQLSCRLFDGHTFVNTKIIFVLFFNFQNEVLTI